MQCGERLAAFVFMHPSRLMPSILPSILPSALCAIASPYRLSRDTVGSVYFSLLGDVTNPPVVGAVESTLATSAAPPGFESSGQGEMMALRCFIQTSMSIVAPLIWNSIYAATVGGAFPGFVFYCIAAGILLALVATLWMPAMTSGTIIATPTTGTRPARGGAIRDVQEPLLDQLVQDKYPKGGVFVG
jgi:hypothetical protein